MQTIKCRTTQRALFVISCQKSGVCSVDPTLRITFMIALDRSEYNYNVCARARLMLSCKTEGQCIVTNSLILCVKLTR